MKQMVFIRKLQLSFPPASKVSIRTLIFMAASHCQTSTLHHQNGLNPVLVVTKVWEINDFCYECTQG